MLFYAARYSCSRLADWSGQKSKAADWWGFAPVDSFGSYLRYQMGLVAAMLVFDKKRCSTAHLGNIGRNIRPQCIAVGRVFRKKIINTDFRARQHALARL